MKGKKKGAKKTKPFKKKKRARKKKKSRADAEPFKNTPKKTRPSFYIAQSCWWDCQFSWPLRGRKIVNLFGNCRGLVLENLGARKRHSLVQELGISPLIYRMFIKDIYAVYMMYIDTLSIQKYPSKFLYHIDIYRHSRQICKAFLTLTFILKWCVLMLTPSLYMASIGNKDGSQIKELFPELFISLLDSIFFKL